MIIQNETINLTEVSQINNDFELFGGQYVLKKLIEQITQNMLNFIRKHKNIFASSVKDLTGCSNQT